MMAATTRRKLDLHLRWIVRKDLEDVMEIERHCFDEPWAEEDFLGWATIYLTQKMPIVK